MIPEPDLDAALARVADRRGAFGARLVRLAQTPSTNDVAARLASDGAPEGTVVLAGEQTRGRGRLGRAWHSPPGSGLYMSVVFRPGEGLADEAAGAAVARRLTLAAGVAAAEAVRGATGLGVELKWPNDLVVGRPRRKLGGLLAEGATVAGRVEFVVLGLGLNLTAAAYPPEIAAIASSLEVELGRPVDAASVAAETLAALAERYADLKRGRAREVLDRWRGLAPSAAGGEVEWTTSRGPVRGTAAGIDDEGALLVRVDDRTERVVTGEVRWL
jgi:BirA family biotin operon repressor/biotin-[acetyl-CoA-carboxylase] ligase